MNFDDLKDQLSERFTAAWGALQENSTFNTLREKYETLTPQAQKGLHLSALLLVILMFIYIPYSYFSSSSVFIEDFESNRNMIRSLLKASRNSRQPPPLPPAQSFPQLQIRIQSILSGSHLLPDQIEPISPLTDRPAGGLVSPVIQQVGAAVSLKNLNLSQILEIGQKLQNLGEGTQVVGMEIEASKSKSNYLNVLFSIVNFSFTVEDPDEMESSRPGSRGNSRFPSRPRPGSNADDEDI